MPPYLTIIEYEEKFSPNGRGSVIEIGEVLRHLFVPNLPGSNEKAKLSAIFESAPPWLIWFTFADYTAAVLDLKLPDLSSMKSVARFRKVFDMWWGLPSGTFEVHAWPKHHESELTRTDLSLLRPEPVPVSLTRRERKRMITAPANWPDEWPPLCPLAWLQLLRTNFTSAMAQGGITGFVKDKRHPEFCGEMSPAARYRDVNGLTAAAVAILDCKEI